MTIIMPEAVPTLAAVATKWVASIADLNAPLLTEVNTAAPASLDLSCALYAGVPQVTQSASKTAMRRRACTRETYERTTSVTRAIPDISYAIEPQAVAASDGVKAYETLTEGLSGYLVQRYGPDAKATWAVGQFVWILPVVLGPALVIAPEGDDGEFQVTQVVDLTGPIRQRKAIVAGP